MPDLTPNHPAVTPACVEGAKTLGRSVARTGTINMPDVAVACITAALPHLTADDLRDTDAAEEIRTEGWLQGWAAGRDLDGDEDATPHLRHTTAGRKLMAEAWDEGARFAQGGRVYNNSNPYLEADA